MPVLLLLAGLLANGTEWDLLQVVAWTRMTVTYTQTMSLGEALKLTFSPDKPCALCRAVTKGRQNQSSPLPSDDKLREKIDLVFQPVSKQFATVTAPERWSLSDLKPLGAERASPPVPPPRVLV